MRIVITGGGTGGHICPAISVAQALLDAVPGVELLCVGSSHGPEGKMFTEAGFDFTAIPSAPLTKSVSFHNLAALMKLMAGVFRARKVLARFRPDVVLGTGGYTTAAVLIGARTLGFPIAIHEQNAVPGRTNLWLSRIADKICVSVESSADFLPKDKVAFTGLPIRKEFNSLPDKQSARRALGLKEEAFTLLVTGGSQGARNVNEVVLDSWPLIDDGATQVLHQVGQGNLKDALARAANSFAGLTDEARTRYHVEPYVDMPVAMASADLVISRSGGTIAEITAAGLASILFPYPYHRDQHQKRNAEYMVERGAAIMCEDATTDARALSNAIIGLRSSPETLMAMSRASEALGKVNAAAKVAEVVISLADA